MNTTRSHYRSKYNENNQNDLGTMSEMIDPKEDTKNDGNFQNDTVTKSEIIDNKESVENNESNKNETGRGGRFPRYLVTNLVTNSSLNLVIHQIW